MIKFYGKAVKLSNDTLLLIDMYKTDLSNKTDDSNLKRFIKELSYDKIIKTCFSNALVYSDDRDLSVLYEKRG